MSQQEIGIKLKADTSEALKSVKELERTMSGLEGIKNRGEADKGFLSQNDVKRFKQLSQQAESVYKDFLTQYDRMKRQFDRKKKDLENSMKSATDQTTIRNLQRQIEQLDAQRSKLEAQHTISEQMNARNTVNSDQINNMRTSNGFSRLAQNIGTGAMSAVIGALSFGKLFGVARQGMGLIKNEEAYGAQLGNRWNAYNGDYTKLRKDAMNTGLPNGYTAMETMQTADTYTSLAGSKSASQTWKNVDQIQKNARAMGLDPNQLAQAGGTMTQIGALKDGEQRKFASILAGAISKEGMQGRDKELVDAVTSVAQQSASTQTSMTKGGLDQIVGLEAALGQNIPGLKGQRGAQIIGSMDEGIKSRNNNVDMLLGWGTKYQGLSGRAALDRQKSKGVTDPANVRAIFTNLEKATGGNKDLEQEQLQEIFGWSGDQASAILNNPELMKTLKNGGLTKKQMEQLQKNGASSLDKKGTDYNDSKAGQRSRIGAQWERTKKAGGEVLDNIWRPVSDAFTSLPPWMQWGGMLGGASAATMFGGKALQGGINWLGRKFSRPVSSVNAGANKSFLARTGEFFGKVGKGAGKLLGPMGDLAMFQGIDSGTRWFWDNAIGHKKGMEKTKGLFDFGPTQHYKDDKQGWLSKLFFGTKASAAELSPAELSKAEKERQKNQQLASKTNDTEVKKKENLRQEKENIDKKANVVDRDKSVKDKEKQNIDSIKTGSSGSGGGGGIMDIFSKLFGGLFGGGSGGGGGFFSNIWSGIKNFFGFGGGSGGSGGGGVGASPTSAGGNAGTIWNFLAGKGMNAGAIAGIMGNLKQESQLNPAEAGGGLAQWIGPRQQALQSYAKQTGGDPKSLDTQLNYLWKELSSGQYGSISKLNSMNASDAAQYFEKNFEGAGIPMMQNRINYANGFYSQYGSNFNANAAGGASNTLNVNVSGSIQGMNQENQRLIANSISTKVAQGSPINLMYQFQQGVGGNR